MNANESSNPVVKNAISALSRSGVIAKNAPNPEKQKAIALKYIGDALNALMRCNEVYNKLGLKDAGIKKCQETLKAEFSKVNALSGQSAKFKIGDIVFYRNRYREKMAGEVRRILAPVGSDGVFTYQLFPTKASLPRGYQSILLDTKAEEDILEKVK